MFLLGCYLGLLLLLGCWGVGFWVPLYTFCVLRRVCAFTGLLVWVSYVCLRRFVLSFLCTQRYFALFLVYNTLTYQKKKKNMLKMVLEKIISKSQNAFI
jgi:hypothetical protein